MVKPTLVGYFISSLLTVFWLRYSLFIQGEGLFMNGTNQPAVSETVIKLVIENPMVKVDRVDASMSLAELNVDSLEKLSIAMDLENAFGLQITDQQVEDVSTVADIIGLVDQMLVDRAAQALTGESDEDINPDGLDRVNQDDRPGHDAQPSL